MPKLHELDDSLFDFVASTDGACRSNPGGQGGWGVVLRDGDVTIEFQGVRSSTTNNRAELIAILAALRFCEDGDRVLIRSDSKYAIRVSNKTWSASANLDLLQPIWDEIERLEVHWKWVRGHDGDPDNERADDLAREAAHLT